jgi:hypothetical protein
MIARNKRIALVAAAVATWGLVQIPVAGADTTCVDGTVRRTRTADEYDVCRAGGWLHVVPCHTDSGDGYCPGQQLPPWCVRFPATYTCPTDGPPPDWR